VAARGEYDNFLVGVGNYIIAAERIRERRRRRDRSFPPSSGITIMITIMMIIIITGGENGGGLAIVHDRVGFSKSGDNHAIMTISILQSHSRDYYKADTR